MTVLGTILPLFGVIAIGFAAVRTGVITAEGIRPLAETVLRLALPALIFLAVAGTPGRAPIDPGLLAGYAAGSLASFLACLALARIVLGLALPAAAVVGLGAGMANSGFMGFPIAAQLMGPETAATLLAHCMVVENVLILPLALSLVALGEARGRALRDALTGIVKNPLILALLAGFAVAASGQALPAPVADTLELLARLSAPAALLVIGGMLATLRPSGLGGSVALAVAGKLALHPVAVALALSVVPDLDPRLMAGGILFAAMPMVTIYPLLGARAGQGPLAASALFAATLASFVTLSLAIPYLPLGH